MKKIKIGILTGIILISMFFLFTQPIKAETEIIGVYPVEVASGDYADLDVYAHWDSDGLLDVESYNRIDGTGLNFQYSYSDINGIRKSIIYLQFKIPNNTKEIKSMKLRMYENYFAHLNETDIVPMRAEMVINSWNYDIENGITYYMNWSKRPEGMGIITLTKWTDLTIIGYKYIELVSFVDYIENETLSISIESLLNRTHSLSFWSREYADAGGSITKVPTLIIEYKEEPPEPNPPNPFTLTSDADTPDIDGLFTLYWISSENSDNYSIYKNGVLFNSGWIYTEYYMIIDSNGHYNFMVIAFNEYGNTSSNEITVVVEIPPPPKPNPFTLTSNANNPDMDGIFTLYWTESTHTDTYSIYQNDVLVDNKLTTLHYDIRIYLDGSYVFKVIAINDYGNMSSNEVNVNIEIPLPPPNPFMLTSNADNPDADGIFMLYWSSSEYAEVYSVYCDGVLLEWGITNLYCNIKVYTSGSYNFKVVALNDYGQVDSNIITINVDIYIVEPEPEPIPEPELIPKIDVILYITMFTLIGIVIGSSLFYFGLKFKKTKNRKEAI